MMLMVEPKPGAIPFLRSYTSNGLSEEIIVFNLFQLENSIGNQQQSITSSSNSNDHRPEKILFVIVTQNLNIVVQQPGG